MRTLSLSLVSAVAAMLLIPSAAQITSEQAVFCARVESRGEGQMPIPEESFTQSEAFLALDSLSSAVEAATPEADFVSIENDLLRVKGYLLRVYALADSADIEPFCNFIESEAYVRH